MSAAPTFSVIIPARNAQTFLGETLDSLSAQNLEDFEAIVVDDGSSDETAAIAHAHAARDRRIRMVAGAAQGVSAARNFGLAQTGGEFVLFLDADDLLAPDALTRFRVALNSSDAPAALGEVTRISENGSPLPGANNLALAEEGDHLTGLLAKNFVVNGGALAVRRTAISRCGGYDPNLAYGEDWEFWCRLAELGDFALVPGGPVLSYRQVAAGANYRARGSVFARTVPCLDKMAGRSSLQQRFGRRLSTLLRARRIDIFWSGVRSEYQFGNPARALAIGLAGLVFYPDSLARPGLALRLVKSMRRAG